MKKQTFIILGPPGSGKSTQAELLSIHLGIPWLSMGRTLRNIAKTDSQLGKEIATLVDHGELVSDAIIEQALRHTLAYLDLANGIIFEGVPRSAEQWLIFDKILSDFQLPYPIVFYIDIQDKTVSERIAHRQATEKVDIRHDDSAEKLKKRLDWTKHETEPLMTEFRDRGVFHKIDGEQSIEKIAQDIWKVVEHGHSH